MEVVEGNTTDMTQMHFVIFAEAPGSCYIAKEGSPTMMISKAARFDSFAEAKTFAEANHIVLNGHTYIGLEDFTDSEMCG
jgi:hypothetical protein